MYDTDKLIVSAFSDYRKVKCILLNYEILINVEFQFWTKCTEMT